MMRLSEAAAVLNAQYFGEDKPFTSIGTDSRNIVSGQLFVALKGDKFDGHTFAAEALKQGAAAVMVNQNAGDYSSAFGQALVVPDTYQALGQLAAYWRSQFSKPVIAITGSNGKTTVKEMLASILKASVHTSAARDDNQVLATEGNLNNHIGLPLTLLKLSAKHRYAVVEMGMNHSGEIRYLTHLAKPNVVVINNAGNAHLGELGSYEAIAKAKGEIIEGLVSNGIAVLNADDQFFPLWKSLVEKKLATPRSIMTFGLNNPADVTANYVLAAYSTQMTIKTAVGEIDVQLPTPGLHNVMNALAATAAALAVGISLLEVKSGLEAYKGVKGRLQTLAGLNNALVIDDTYNANPMSMKVAIDVLRTQAGTKLLVLGDMGELGESAVAMHKEIGEYAKNAGIDALLTFGALSQHMTKAFGKGATHYDAITHLVADLQSAMQETTTVLVKGSRFMAMERVVHAITQPNIDTMSKPQNSNLQKEISQEAH